MPQSQPIDSKQVEGLSSQFQRRWEAGFHWRSMASMLLGSAALRAAWPMSSVDFAQPECIDISGQGNHLQAAAALGNVTFGYDTAGISPVAIFGGGANQYLFLADGGVANWADIAIAGGDVQILAAQRGLTLGGWFQASLAGGGQYLIAKDDGVNRQYALFVNPAPGNTAAFTVWPGAIVATSAAAIVSGWNHIVGTYDQTSQTVFITLNGVTTSGAVGAAPAALADTGVAFTIGADGGGGTLLTGVGSDCFLCAAALPHRLVKVGYHYTKAAYGVK
jgi:hypothetical protein